MVASAVMALAIAVGGFGTTALLVSQPAGLTVEPSALLWEGETDAAHSTKKETKKNNTETPKNDSASSEAESTAASAAQPSAPSQSVKEEPAACLPRRLRLHPQRRLPQSLQPRKQLLLPP